MHLSGSARRGPPDFEPVGTEKERVARASPELVVGYRPEVGDLVVHVAGFVTADRKRFDTRLSRVITPQCGGFRMDLLPPGSYVASMNVTKVSLGLMLLAVSSIIVFATGIVDGSIPVLLAAIGALGMAAGTLLFGTGDEGRPV